MPTPVTVVGVVGNTIDAGYSSPAGEAVYGPYSQVSAVRVSIVAMGRGNDRATIAAMRRALAKTDPVVARLTVPGVALGLAAVWSASGLRNAIVFGVQARSPFVLASAGGALLLLAVLATLPPALRAMRVDIRRGVSG